MSAKADKNQGAPAAKIAVAVAIMVAGVLAAGAGGLLSSGSRIVFFVLANLILAFDVIDLAIRLWLKRLHGAAACGPSVDLGLQQSPTSSARWGCVRMQ